MLSDQLEQRFSSHVPTADGIQKMRKIRKAVRDLAEHIDLLVPEGRDKSTALTHLQNVMMFSNAGISQGFPLDPAELDIVADPVKAAT